MQKEDSYKYFVKALLLELNEDPTYKFKLIFSIMSVIPFLSFFYVIIYLVPHEKLFSLEMSIIMVLTIFISLCGFVWGYMTIKQLFAKIIVYAAKVKHSEELKSELVASISHDFKTPISILKMSLAKIIDSQSQVIDQKSKQHMECCQGVLDHMYHTINTLLDLYKVEAGMIDLKKEPHNISAIINNQLKEFEIMFTQKRIKLIKKLPKNPLVALIDRDKIIEVITNLLSNALKYTPDNGTIIINASPIKGFVRLEFINSGGNIPIDKLGTIFEKFHRLNSVQEGTGLGLAIAKDIVEIHDGRIWAENFLNKYVKFSVILPTDNTSEIKFEPEVGDKKVLIVDDTQADIDLAKKHLKGLGYQLITCARGAEALKIANENKPDLILLDVVLPDMDGFEIVRKLKAENKTRYIPVLMITSMHSDEFKLLSMDLGVDDFLPKPIDKEELIVRVKSILKDGNH